MKPDRSLSFWRQVVALQAEAFAGVPDGALVDRFAFLARRYVSPTCGRFRQVRD
jgi:hypothetical protein